MLTHPYARRVYRKLAVAGPAWLRANSTLVGKTALLVYRKCGRAEAQEFIDLMRVAVGPRW
jgi:hypothetical protein